MRGRRQAGARQRACTKRQSFDTASARRWRGRCARSPSRGRGARQPPQLGLGAHGGRSRRRRRGAGDRQRSPTCTPRATPSTSSASRPSGTRRSAPPFFAGVAVDDAHIYGPSASTPPGPAAPDPGVRRGAHREAICEFGRLRLYGSTGVSPAHRGQGRHLSTPRRPLGPGRPGRPRAPVRQGGSDGAARYRPRPAARVLMCARVGPAPTESTSFRTQPSRVVG